MPCACSPTIRYVLCPFCTVELDPTCSMKTNQGFSAWDEIGSSFENHQPVTGIGWNGAFCNVFFLKPAAGFPALHNISCAMFGSSQEILWDLLDEDLKPLHTWLLWFTTTTACLAPWPLSMGILGWQNSRLWKKKTGKTPGFIGDCLFSPNGCICGSSHIQWNTLAHNEL